jgi:stage IV sporulation protein FB
MTSSAAWQFQLFNFPVRVHLSFFLVALFLGFSIGLNLFLLLWVLIVFFSVLLHELGHAIVAEYYGRSPRIELTTMGGLTISTRNSLLSYPKEIFLSFAGPLIGFILGGILFAIMQFAGPISNPYLRFIISQLLWVNIGWGIINLIPIQPLDGGSIMRNLYHWIRNPYDERTPLIISMIFGVLAIITALVLGQFYLALLVGWLVYNNYMAYRRGFWSDTFI